MTKEDFPKKVANQVVYPVYQVLWPLMIKNDHLVHNSVNSGMISYESADQAPSTPQCHWSLIFDSLFLHDSSCAAYGLTTSTVHGSHGLRKQFRENINNIFPAQNSKLAAAADHHRLHCCPSEVLCHAQSRGWPWDWQRSLDVQCMSWGHEVKGWCMVEVAWGLVDEWSMVG